MAKSTSGTSRDTREEDTLSLHNRLIIPILLRWWQSLFGLNTQVPPVEDMYSRLLQLIAETQGDVSFEVTQALTHVSIGLGFLAYDRFPQWQQAAFVQDLRRRRAYEGIDRVVLTPSERKILEHVAAVIRIPFNTTRTKFLFAEIEAKRPEGMDAWEKKQHRW